MRILFIAHRTPFPPNKGEKLRSCWQLRTLAKAHEVDLFCFYDDPEDEKHFSELRRHCNDCYIDKLPYFASRMRALAALLSGRPFSTAYFYSPKMLHRIQVALKSRHYDRVFVFSSSMARYVEDQLSVPKILDLVDVDSDKWRQYAERSAPYLAWLWRLEAQRLAAYESSLVRGFSTTTVCTEAERTLLRSIAPSGKIRVIENHIDVEEYDLKIHVSDRIRSWGPYVIFSGSMDYLPNVDAATFFHREVFPLIQRVRPATRFVIAGRNPHPSIRKLESDSSVVVTGSVSDMKPYLHGAAVAVAPLRIARGVQNKVLEALAVGIPVVCSSATASALPDKLRSLVKAADTPRDFAEKVMASIKENSSAASARRRAGLKQYIEGLSLDSQFEELIRNPSSDLYKGGAIETSVATQTA